MKNPSQLSAGFSSHPEYNTSLKWPQWEWGLLKIHVWWTEMKFTKAVPCNMAASPGPAGQTVQCGAHPVSEGRDMTVCICLPPPTAAMLHDGIICATGSRFTSHFLLHVFWVSPLSPPVSLCPQASAIRCCQGYPFLKSSCWCRSPGGADERGLDMHKIGMWHAHRRTGVPSFCRRQLY